MRYSSGDERDDSIGELGCLFFVSTMQNLRLNIKKNTDFPVGP